MKLVQPPKAHRCADKARRGSPLGAAERGGGTVGLAVLITDGISMSNPCILGLHYHINGCNIQKASNMRRCSDARSNQSHEIDFIVSYCSVYI